MSVFSSPIRYRPWLSQVTILSTILGALLALSLKTQDKLRALQLGGTRPGLMAGAYAQLREDSEDQRRQIAELRKQLGKYREAAVNDDSHAAKMVSEELDKANLALGLQAATGPGITVTLRDAKNIPPEIKKMGPEAYAELVKPYNIHDADILTVVNELRAAGAEAVAVNDQRVTPWTAIRCVGPTVLINNIPVAPPFEIKAVGNKDTMMSALLINGGARDTIAEKDPTMFSVDKFDSLTLPAFAGAAPIRFSHTATEGKADAALNKSEAQGKAGAGTLPGVAAAQEEKGKK
ncbi:MAG: DUF881 domain-containing protein [Armatimonas sp.]